MAVQGQGSIALPPFLSGGPHHVFCHLHPCVCASNMQTKTVYLLVRGKKTLTAQQRVERLLCDPLFNQLHTQVAEAGSSDSSSSGSNPFRKVVAVQGDLCLHDLGLSQDDKQLLLQRVTHVIHCAASIELDACIKYTLRCVERMCSVCACLLGVLGLNDSCEADTAVCLCFPAHPTLPKRTLLTVGTMPSLHILPACLSTFLQTTTGTTTWALRASCSCQHRCTSCAALSTSAPFLWPTTCPATASCASSCTRCPCSLTAGLLSMPSLWLL